MAAGVWNQEAFNLGLGKGARALPKGGHACQRNEGAHTLVSTFRRRKASWTSPCPRSWRSPKLPPPRPQSTLSCLAKYSPHLSFGHVMKVRVERVFPADSTAHMARAIVVFWLTPCPPPWLACHEVLSSICQQKHETARPAACHPAREGKQSSRSGPEFSQLPSPRAGGGGLSWDSGLFLGQENLGQARTDDRGAPVRPAWGGGMLQDPYQRRGQLWEIPSGYPHFPSSQPAPRWLPTAWRG